MLHCSASCVDRRQPIPGRRNVLIMTGGNTVNRIHLDLVADDFAEATQQAKALGASPVGAVHENLWQVWQDPEDNEFCIGVS